MNTQETKSFNKAMLELRLTYPHLIPDPDGFINEDSPYIIATPLLVPFCIGEREFNFSNFYPSCSPEVKTFRYDNEDPDYIWQWSYFDVDIKLNFRNYRDTYPDLLLYVSGSLRKEWIDLGGREWSDADVKTLFTQGVHSRVIESIFE